ncbi:MAG: phosphogluconate dehydrogenase (NAD(+)-dependent, decarboxylating) [Pseudomonadota bacterium]
MDGSFSIVGLGRMGAGLTRRLLRAGITPAVWDIDAAAIESLSGEGATAITALDALAALPAPRTVWLMLPSGKVTEDTIETVSGILSAGDCIIDGGNTYYKDDLARAKRLAERDITYIDVGVSGGIWGLEEGFSLMIGGPAETVECLDAIFDALAPGGGTVEQTPGRAGADPRPEKGYVHCGPVGSGHFAKMVHNGIEYGLMQAYAEGFDILKNAQSTAREEGLNYDFDVAAVAEVWRRGSVIRSWLLDLNANALNADPELEGYEGFVSDSGEARWTIEAAIEQDVPVPTISAALFARFQSRRQQSYADKLLSAMREQFGGHIEGQTPSGRIKKGA